MLLFGLSNCFVVDALAQDPILALDDSAVSLYQGFYSRVLMNSNGVLGGVSTRYSLEYDYISDPIHNPPERYPFGYQYPIGSKVEYLAGAGLWVGGSVPTPQGRKHFVTTAFTFDDRFFVGEFLRETSSDTFLHANVLQPGCCDRRGFDDDGDGRIDEDPPDGRDNDGDWIRVRDDLNHNGRSDHGEPNVDEDGEAISENDLYATYDDSFKAPRIPQHVPLGIHVWQKSYAWNTLLKAPILPFEYVITRTMPGTLDSVYLAFYAEISPVNVLYRRVTRFFDVQTGYLNEVRTTFNETSIPGLDHFSPIGITFLGASRPVNELRLTCRFAQLFPENDEDGYTYMSSGIIDRDREAVQRSQIMFHLISVGPFLNFRVGDTLKIGFALISGETVGGLHNSIRENAALALNLYRNGFAAPALPPSPPLKVSLVDNRVTLDWSWHSSDLRPNPLEFWDDSNHFVGALPDTHWRRRNAPAGKTLGGRVFEGFRIYRSEYPLFQENQLSIIRQFDVDDDLKYEGQTGLQFTYTDSLITRGKRYWYAVSTFTIPDYYYGYTLDTATGVSHLDTILIDGRESLLQENLINFPIPFAPSQEVGKVKVVPNPYRTDRDYWYEAGGWEGLGRLWTEDKRLVWFIHLPPRCTIRVFTIAGEVIKVIEHDDDVRRSRGMAVGQEEFTLLSESNRALASGIYVYLVESQLGTQMGKFVVIR